MTSKLKYTADGTPFTEVRPLNAEDCFTKDLSTTLKPEQGFGYFTFYFKDGTSATFKDAGSLQEFLDKLARFHELEKDLEIARKAMNQVMSMGAKNNICYHLKAKTVKGILGKALEQIEHKEK